MKNKLREFWCRFQHDDRDRATTFVKRELCEYLSNEYWDDEIIYTREVDPEYDAIVEEMIDHFKQIIASGYATVKEQDFMSKLESYRAKEKSE